MAKTNGTEHRSFAHLLQDMEGGQLVIDLNEELHKVNLAILKEAERTGTGKGEITVTLKLSADRGGTVNIDAEIKTKEPKKKRERTVNWMTKEGNLSTSNPRQLELGVLKEVPPQQPVREPGANANAEE